MRGKARRACGSQPAHWVARAGLAARGIIYILIGWVAILVALGLLIFGVHGLCEARWRKV